MPKQTKNNIYEIFKQIYGGELGIEVNENTTILDVLNAYGIKKGIYNPNAQSSSNKKKKANTIQEALNDIVIKNTIITDKKKDLNDFIGGTNFSQVLINDAWWIKETPFGWSDRNPKILFFNESMVQLTTPGFKANKNLNEIWIPGLAVVTNQGYDMFQECSNLKLVDLGHGAIYLIPKTDLFKNCENLEVLFIRNGEKSAGVIKPSTTTFTGTKFDPQDLGEGGIVYVPSKYLSQYQASTEWAQRAKVKEFRAIEDSSYNGNEYVPYDWENN